MGGDLKTVLVVIFLHPGYGLGPILTFCILIDFPIHIDTISMGLSILYFKGPQVEVSILLLYICP